MTTEHRARDCRDRSVWALLIQRPELRSCRLDTDRQRRPCIRIHFTGENSRYRNSSAGFGISNYYRGVMNQ